MNLAESFTPTDHATVLAPLVQRLRSCVSARDDALFTEFLPRGYALMALDTLPAAHATDLLYAKVRVGMLITLYDDLADNPRWRDHAALRALYRLPFTPVAHRATPLVRLAASLWHEVVAVLRRLPQYAPLRDLFAFDVQQIYQAMRYSELLGQLPGLANRAENRMYLAHNMGMVLVGMMDLMALPTLRQDELGRIRSFFLMAQEVARLSNVLCTWEREITEGDNTSELVAMGIEEGVLDAAAVPRLSTAAARKLLASQVRRLQADQGRLLHRLQTRAGAIESFDARRYVTGLQALHRLHERLQAHL
jgi:hypothetical protein